MWSEQSLTNLVPYAAEALTRHRRSVSRILTAGNQAVDKEIDTQVWREFSLGERAYYCLFWVAYNRMDLAALRCICPPELFSKMSKLAVDRVIAYQRELTRIDSVLTHARILEAQKRQKKRGTQTPRHIGWTAEDVPAEYFDAETDEAPYRSPRPIAVPEQERPPSPVRKVSVEEYYATRKTPLPKGVALEFDKDSPLWLKLDDRYADKSYEGDEVPSWYKEKE